jgi:hypothetical protein
MTLYDKNNLSYKFIKKEGDFKFLVNEFITRSVEGGRGSF